MLYSKCRSSDEEKHDNEDMDVDESPDKEVFDEVFFLKLTIFNKLKCRTCTTKIYSRI